MTPARVAALVAALAAAQAVSAFAAGSASGGSGLAYLDGVLGRMADAIINPLIRALFAVSLVQFAWGVTKFVRGASDATARETGKNHMIWGIVGMAIMVSVFAVIRLAVGQVGVQPDFSF